MPGRLFAGSRRHRAGGVSRVETKLILTGRTVGLRTRGSLSRGRPFFRYVVPMPRASACGGSGRNSACWAHETSHRVGHLPLDRLESHEHACPYPRA